MGITDESCQLLRDSGCPYANVSIESGSDAMLKRMKRGYTVAHIKQVLVVRFIERTDAPVTSR